MYLSNDVKVYCKSMGKIFKITHIAKSVDDANKYMENHSMEGVIAENKKTGLIFIAEFNAIKIPSSVLPD